MKELGVPVLKATVSCLLSCRRIATIINLGLPYYRKAGPDVGLQLLANVVKV